ncbi:MAG: phosphatase PAP2 family protein, partial [Gammaproteobacteria bacterium]|nr:phosphatase PAP2 family protein [Gammaproteobacteria bacterium]
MGVDGQILLWINQGWADPWLDALFAWVSGRGAFSIPLLLAILAGLAAWRGRDGVKLWGLLILVVLLGDGIGNLLKHLIEQP